VPMKWEIARIFVVGTGGSGFCAEAAPSGVIGFFMAVAPYSEPLERFVLPLVRCGMVFVGVLKKIVLLISGP